MERSEGLDLKNSSFKENEQLFRGEFLAQTMQYIGFLHHTYRLFASKIYALYMQHIGYSNGAEPISTM